MVNNRTINARDFMESLRSGLGESIHIFDTQIPHSVGLRGEQSGGVSIFKYDPDAKVRRAYEDFTKEVMALEARSKDRPRNDWVR